MRRAHELTLASGDSWTETGFQVTGTQPSPHNPFGNPKVDPSKAFLSDKWISYLSTKYNDSIIETYNLAVSASTIDASFVPHGNDLVSQVQKTFIPTYASKKSSTWHPSKSLFAILLGVNDVEVSATNATAASNWNGIFKSYSNLANQVE